MRTASFMEALDMAIDAEQKAYDLYTGLAAQLKNETLAKIVRSFAAEEQRHKEKLEGVKAGGSLGPAVTNVTDLKIGDDLAEPDVGPDMDFQEVLTLAMKAEKKAFDIYMQMSEQFEEDSAEYLLFLQMAQEEAKHKLRFETWYEQDIMGQN